MPDAASGSKLGVISIVCAVMAGLLPLVGWALFFWGFAEGAGEGGNASEELFIGAAGSLVLGGLSLLLVICGGALGALGLYRASKDPGLSGTSSLWGAGLNLIGVPLTWFAEWALIAGVLGASGL